MNIFLKDCFQISRFLLPIASPLYFKKFSYISIENFSVT